MRTSRIGAVAGLLAMISLTACSEFTASGDPLNDAEAGELAAAIVGQTFPGTGDMGAAAPPAAAPMGSASAPAEKITLSLDDSGPCEGGGSASLKGNLTIEADQQAQTGTLEYNFTVTPTGCVVTTADAKVFTLTGDPSVKGEGKLSWTGTTFNGDLNYSGKFNWTAADGRAGACGVDLKAAFNLSSEGAGSASASVSGTVCGVTVNRNVAVEG